ncbi:MAG: hypothetical protein ACOCQD_02290 [archaeon]
MKEKLSFSDEEIILLRDLLEKGYPYIRKDKTYGEVYGYSKLHLHWLPYPYYKPPEKYVQIVFSEKELLQQLKPNINYKIEDLLKEMNWNEI